MEVPLANMTNDTTAAPNDLIGMTIIGRKPRLLLRVDEAPPVDSNDEDDVVNQQCLMTTVDFTTETMPSVSTTRRSYPQCINHQKKNRTLTMLSDASISHLHGNYEEFELLPIQSWFFRSAATNADDATNLNQLCASFTLLLPEEHEYSVEEIEDALEELMNSHDVLRASFLHGKRLRILDVGEGELAFLDLRETELQEQGLLRIMESVNVQDGPLWRAVLHSGYKLFLCFHQLIFDGTSASVVAEWLQALLSGTSLRQAPCSYERFLKNLNDYAVHHGASEAPFWEAQLSERDPRLERRINEPSYKTFTLTDQESGTLLLVTPTETTGLLLASLARTLTIVFGRPCTSVAQFNNGRFFNNRAIDLTRTVGMFYCYWPLLLDGTGSAQEAIDRTKQLIQSTPETGTAFTSIMMHSSSSSVASAETAPQVAFSFYDRVTFKPDEKAKDWSVIPFRRTPPIQLMASFQDTSLSVMCQKQPDGRIQVGILSFLPEDVTTRIVTTLERCIHETIACCPVKRRNSSGASRKTSSHRRPSSGNTASSSTTAGGEKRKKKGITIRPSTIVRTFDDKSMVKNQHIFFVAHPSGSDSSVYASLACQLCREGFCSKGIDNTLFTSNKKGTAKNLKKLARFYVDALEQAESKSCGDNNSHDAPLYLLGWCIGGKIALEMAYILEKKGTRPRNSPVWVLLLDSFLYPFGSPDGDATCRDDPSLLESLDLHHVQGMAADIPEVERELAQQPLSGTLKRSKVVLLKAGKLHGGLISREHVASFDNGFSGFVRKLTVILLPEHDHDSIIGAHKEVVDVLVDSVHKSCRVSC